MHIQLFARWIAIALSGIVEHQPVVILNTIDDIHGTIKRMVGYVSTQHSNGFPQLTTGYQLRHLGQQYIILHSSEMS